jgi:hypothetical protein
VEHKKSMLTIRHAALAADLDFARARMDLSRDAATAQAEWDDLTDEQRAMFLSTAIMKEGTYEDAIESHGHAGSPDAGPH